jgi:hypothetical protein
VGSLSVQVCWQLYNGLTEETRCVTEGGEHRRRWDVCMVVGWKQRRSYLVRDYCTSLPASTTWAAWLRVCVQTTSRWKMQRRRQRKQDDALIHYC